MRSRGILINLLVTNFRDKIRHPMGNDKLIVRAIKNFHEKKTHAGLSI